MSQKAVIDTDPCLETLQALVGRRVRHRGAVWCVVDVMEDRLELVLESCAADAAVQANQYGEPRRRVRHRIALPVFDGQAPGDDYLSLELLPE